MLDQTSPGTRLRGALNLEKPLQVVGVINAYAARLAERSGFRALYLSGGGVSAASLGVPDLGIITLDDILIDARRITDTSALPLLVDIDTGFGSAFNIARTVKALIKVDAAGIHIEDQVQAKRCGHRPGKAIVPLDEMVDRVKAAVDARIDASFVIMARTDALAVEGLQSVIDRASACVDAGADMIFPEAVSQLSIYQAIASAVHVPILANLTEFGLTPLFTLNELRSVGVSLALYPLSAFRAMSAAAIKIYETLRQEGTQASVLPLMQTRSDLYQALDYEAFEQKLDQLFHKEEHHE
ncbi:MAG TPA: methylisocitrate lyase [Anaerolineaceae bacterium]|jgi:methylisocitrate lyase